MLRKQAFRRFLILNITLLFGVLFLPKPGYSQSVAALQVQLQQAVEGYMQAQSATESGLYATGSGMQTFYIGVIFNILQQVDEAAYQNPQAYCQTSRDFHQYAAQVVDSSASQIGVETYCSQFGY